MNARSEHDVLLKVMELWPGNSQFDVRQNDGGWDIEVSAMYRAPGLSFAILRDLSGFFGTKNINSDNFSEEGCDTCDYGSRYGFRLHIRPQEATNAR